jgi:hypothetical protein
MENEDLLKVYFYKIDVFHFNIKQNKIKNLNIQSLLDESKVNLKDIKFKLKDIKFKNIIFLYILYKIYKNIIFLNFKNINLKIIFKFKTYKQ